MLAKNHHRFLVRRALRRLIRNETIPYRLLIIGILTGCITGLFCAFFQIVPDAVTRLRLDYFYQQDQSTLAFTLLFLICGSLAAFALFITLKYAPEAGGSGIPEIEGALDHKRPVRWWRVLPVKIFGGICSLSSGMILGREGPSIQIGGNTGKMTADLCLISKTNAMSLIAAGGAAGLAAAFNAPLAGMMFVIEELRPQFRYSFMSIKLVAVTVISATVTRSFILNNNPVFNNLPVFESPALASYIFFILLGLIAGVFGVYFNKMVEYFQNTYLRLHRGKIPLACGIIFILGGIFGILSVIAPEASGSGMMSIPDWIVAHEQTFSFLLLLLLWRTVGLMSCFCSGIPGGIFAPSLSIGTLLGAFLGVLLEKIHLPYTPDAGILAITGMCALFAASVRAPITGIVLVAEMTNNFQFILPMMITTLTATLVANRLGGIPIYTQILNRTLRLAKKERIAKENNMEAGTARIPNPKQ